MKRKKHERTLEELYGVTRKISEPKITPILEGKWRMQGPTGDAEHDIQAVSVYFHSEQRSGRHVAKSFHLGAVSGTCTLCAAPCFLCMHDNETESIMETNVVGGCTMEVSCANSASEHHIANASEVRNTSSSTCSHGSFSEIGTSMVISEVLEMHPEDIEMPQKLPLGETDGQNEVIASLPDDKFNGGDESSHHIQVCSEIAMEWKDCPLAVALSVQIVEEDKATIIDSGGIVANNGGVSIVVGIDNMDPSAESAMIEGFEQKMQKSNTLLEKHEMGWHQAMSPVPPPLKDSEDKELHILEDDVKICDICGDAGREELLAICSRCSDGAEHTYCMQIMLEKVPEGNWFCEECKFKEDAKNKHSDKFEPSGLPQMPTSNKSQNSEENYYLQPITSLENKILSVRTTKGIQNLDEKSTEMAGRNGIISGTSTMPKPSLVCGTSCKILNADKKLKPGNVVSVHKNPSLDSSKVISHALASSGPTSLEVLESSQCTLLKSSFDKLTTIKQLPESSAQKGKVYLESALADAKKELLTLGKSASFKGRSAPSMSSTGRTQSISQVSNIRSMKHKKEVPVERKNSFVLCHPRASSPFSATSMLPKAAPKSICTGQDTSAIPKVGEKSCNTIIQSGQFVSPVEKSNGTGSLRHPFSAVNRTLRCDRCNEMGHAKLFCPIDKLRLSAFPLFKDRTRDMCYKSISSKCAVEAAISRTKIHKNGRLGDWPNGLPLSGTVLNSETEDCLSNPYMHLRNTTNLEVTVDVKDIMKSSAIASTETAVLDDGKQCSFMPSEVKHSFKNENSIDTEFSELKPSMQILPEESYVHDSLLRVSGIPKLDYIWQGCFEVQRTGKLSEVCDGLQAHLSTCASPKVINVATNFPIKIQLDEVACVSSWPSQFQRNCPTEESIALFFFATDIVSYEKNYKRLLENMLQNDLALRGNLGGVELLIFPSNKLIERSQRWNRLLFLWGVFKAKKSSYMDSASGNKKLPHGFVANVDHSGQYFSPPAAAELSGIERVRDCEKSTENKLPIHTKEQKIENSHCCRDEISSEKRYCPVELQISKQSSTLYDNKMGIAFKKSTFHDNAPEHIVETDVQIFSKVKEDAHCLLKATFDLNERVGEHPDTEISENRNGGKVTSVQRLVQPEAALASDIKNIILVDLLGSVSKPDLRCSYSSSMEPISQTVTSTRKTSPSEKACTLDDSRLVPKKLMEHVNEDCSNNGRVAVGCISSNVCHVLSDVMKEGLQKSDAHEETASFESSKDSVSLFSHIVLSSPAEEPRSANPLPTPVIPLVEAPKSSAPNLELALDMQNKLSSKQTYTGRTDNMRSPDRNRDDASTLLSLSLAFPLPRK